MTFKQAFGLFVRQVRRERKLSQIQLGDASGIAQSTISALERGAERDLLSSHIDALLAALGVQPSVMCVRVAEILMREPPK